MLAAAVVFEPDSNCGRADGVGRRSERKGAVRGDRRLRGKQRGVIVTHEKYDGLGGFVGRSWADAGGPVRSAIGPAFFVDRLVGASHERGRIVHPIDSDAEGLRL